VRIPLNYYQILGIPERNLSELEQAYQDRLLQLPRQEYSDAAIESRKQLIGVAYQVLSDPDRRAEYTTTQLPLTPETEQEKEPETETVLTAEHPALSAFYHRPQLEIAPEHFLGGLLILFEQGEYEEINSICMPYLGNNGRSSNSGSLHPHLPIALTPSGNLRQDLNSNINPAILAKLKHTANGAHIIPLKPDIVLAMVSSFYELGEREWGDRCYEEAVIHYETAKKILVQEDLFPQIQGQIDLRLDRLRPYRISSLVSLPLDRHEQRGQGIQFLEELLESACTNEVKCQERFGLNSERTIPFIHETLPHLTAAEQRNLFSQVARDSHQLGANALNVMQLACTYLHVHALIVQGFAYRNPQLIYTAQQILQYRLSQRIDVTIEQAICALLLGQTEEANQLLITAPESAALVVIRQQSQGFSDLLRGLCWYIQSWLKDEAFPCFRDLVAKDPSLDAYFADRDVRDFASRVPTHDANISGWAASSPQLIEVPISGDLSGSVQNYRSELSPQDASSPTLSSRLGDGNSSSFSTSWQSHSDRLGSGPIAPAVRVEQSLPVQPDLLPTEVECEPNSNVIQLEQERQRRRSMPTARTIDGQFEQTYLQERPQPQPVATPTTSSQIVPSAKVGKLAKRDRGTGAIVRPRRTRRKPNIPRILLVGAGGVTCMWGATWLATTIRDVVTVKPAVNPVMTATSRVAQVSPGASAKPPSQPAATGLLSKDLAQQTVKTWLGVKTNSLNKGYQIDQLKDILAEPALSNALKRANSARLNGVHWRYEHRNIGISSIKQTSPTANLATIQAQVEEVSQYYQGDKLKTDKSYSKQLLVEYSLVRQKDRWYIKDMDVVKQLDN
jgi:tetratricopeptide (TPR) repeat protein